MRFDYQYRTRENELKVGSLTSCSRDEAFKVLKAQGIRPSRVTLAPGVLNRLASLGKRGWTIVVLALALAGVIFIGVRLSKVNKPVSGDIDPVVMEHLKSSGLNLEAINELLEARRRINAEYRRKIEAEVKRGELTPKAARELLDAAGLGARKD